MSVAVITSIDTQSNDSSAAIERYQDGYRAANALIEFSNTIRYGGIVLAGVILVGGVAEFILNAAEHHGFPATFVSLIALAIFFTLASQIWGRIVKGEGQLLMAAFDSDVNTSPFLSNAQRARVMSLRQKPPIPKCVPVWTE